MHGGPGADHSTLLSFLPLAKEFKLIFYDHRCNGRSLGAEISTLTWESLTADAEALRETLRINEWAVIGHSFGGMVALEYAVRYPQSLSHLCIVDSCGDGRVVLENAPRILRQRGFRKLAADTAQRFFSGQIRQNEFIKCMMILGRAYYSNPTPGFMLREALHGLLIQKNPSACIYGFKELIPSWSVMERLQNIKTQTLIIAGRDDFQFPPEHQRLLAAGISGAVLEIIEGAGHNAHIEKTHEVLAATRRFLKNDIRSTFSTKNSP
jgi:proline iminopeptidase